MTALPAEPIDDAFLVQRAQAGDIDVFATVVERYQARIRVYVATQVRDAAAVDDLAQEVFLRAFRTVRALERGHSLRSWLYGIARNCVLEYLRQNARVVRDGTGGIVEKLDAQRALELAASAKDADAADRALSALRACVAELPEHGATLIERHYFRGETLTAIAASLGRKESAVRMTLLRLRTALRECTRRRLEAT